MRFSRYAHLIFLVILSACANRPIPGPGVETLSQSEYVDKVEKYTKHMEKYEGIVNVLTFTATLINTQVADAQLKQRARLYLWDANTYNEEKNKLFSELDKNTQVFISFYTPERKHDDLAKNQTLWKIFLDADGRRWEGKATKIKLLTNEVRALYPDHTRFATPYILTFPVPLKVIEKYPIRLTLTGSVTSATVEFDP